MIVIVMGVTGSGKTTVGILLAQRLGWDFLDADDFHSAANKAKMHQGIPLTDADRLPWLETMHAKLLRTRFRKTQRGPRLLRAETKLPRSAHGWHKCKIGLPERFL